MSRNVSFSGKRSQPRHRLIPVLIRSLLLTAGASGLCGNPLAADGVWDCRAGSDGGWQCSKDGIPEVRPEKPASATITPLREPPPASPKAADTPADIPPAGPPEEKTPSAPAGAARPAAQPEPVQTDAPQAPPPASVSTAPAPPSQVPVQDESPYVIDNTVSPSTPPPAAIAAEHTPAPTEAIAKPMPGPKKAAPQPPPVQEPVPAQPVTAESRQADAITKIAVSPEPTEEALAAQPGPSTVMPAREARSLRTERLDKGIAWQSCTRIETPFDNNDGQLPIEVTADGAEASDLDKQVRFSGNVEVIQGSQQVFADQVRYQHASGDLFASGDALLVRPDLRIAADEMQYNLHSQQGEARQAEYRLPGILARGTAESATLVDAHDTRYTQINYTTCQPGNSDWQLEADTLQLDTEEGLGTAGGAKLSFKGVPVMYLPKLTFPIDDRRRSGLLIPSFGYGDKHGLDLSLPYYFNLAPNYDLTLTPRLMSKRGIMLGSDFRFLTSSTEGQLEGQYLPHDRKGPAGEKRRGSIALQALSRYNDNLSSALRVNYVSDDNFLSDFGGDLEVTSTSYLERAAELQYATDRLQLRIRAQQYQTIDSTVTKANRPYTRLPQVTFNYHGDSTAGGTPIAYSLDTELVNFQKSGGFVEGRRVDLQPSLSVPLRDTWYHLIPKAGLRYTTYDLDKQTAGLSSSPDRLAPVLSLDGGLYYDRSMTWFGRDSTQTLEPRLYYLFVTREDHTDIPIFDTSEYDFSFDNLFRENRFTSADRLGDANQLTLALTSRINDQANGSELLRASLGSILYLADRKVQLPGSSTNTDDSSAVVGELAADIGGGWRSRAGLMWDPNENTIDQALAQASYRGDGDQVFNATYRLRDGVSTHTDLGLIWPVDAQTKAIARWNYSVSENRNLDALLGLEYGRCCWKVRTLLRQQVTGTNNDQNLSFLVQLELRGLGKLGDNIDAVLNDGIYGYRREHD